MKKFFSNAYKKIFMENKIASISAALILFLLVSVAAALALGAEKTSDAEVVKSSDSDISSADSQTWPNSVSEIVSSEEASSSAPVQSSRPTASKSESAVSKVTVPKPVVSANKDYIYNTNLDIENNVFMDSLVYTGYNLKKHRADGLMWHYVLASQKRGKGWLSDITYGGGSTGYETVNGRPDISFFEKHGLVCASYVTYVYFNYLTNVAGIDTSSLDRPAKSYSANDWYIAAQKWVKKGYSKTIPFTASLNSGFIKFKAKETIPIGSIIAMSDATKPGSKACSHVSIYAGYKNGYNWVFHVGNANGPEFCAIERMHFGPDPQWPLAVITTPSNIRMAALLEVTVKDNTGAALSGVKISLKNTKTGELRNIGVTDKNGCVKAENLSYGDYTVIQTVPSGYSCSAPSVNVKLTTASNSCNKVSFTDELIPPDEPEIPSQTQTSSEAVTSSEEDASGETSTPPSDKNNPDGSQNYTPPEENIQNSGQ